MTWKSRFSGIAALAISLAFLFSSVTAQKTKITKSGAGRVASTNEIEKYRGNLSDDENEIFDSINRERRKKGLGELAWDARLAQLARAYSKKMAKDSFFSHWDRDGKSVVERVTASNIKDWNKIGENLFYCEGYGDFDELAVRGWMNSPDHRRNILDRQFTTTGIGIAQSRDGKIYITQVFIKR